MMPMPDAMTAAVQRAAAREAEEITMTEHERELERELLKAIARAEFAEDQLEVAIKDRDHAERRLVAARADLPETIRRVLSDVCDLPDRTSPDDWPEAMLVTGEELAAILESHLSADVAALQDRAPSEQDGG